MKIFLTIIFFSFASHVSSQTLITAVNFEGNDFFSSNDLRSFMVLRPELDFKQEQLNSDLISIREQYKSQGFYFAQIDSVLYDFDTDSGTVELTIRITENDRVMLGEMEITGNSAIKSEEILSNFETKPGTLLSDVTLNQDINELLEIYESRGLPFASVEIGSINIYNDDGIKKLKLNITINENRKIKISEVRISGNEITNKNVILREVRLPQDGTVTVDHLDNIKARLEKLEIFNEVKYPRIYSIVGKEESGLIIEVTEGNTNTFDGIIGYVPPQLEGESGYFTGKINLSFRNLFGTGRKIAARWEQEVKETQELEFKYAEPYFFSTPFDVQFGFLQRIQDTTYTRRKFDLKAKYEILNNLTVSGLFGFDRIIPADIQNPQFIIADSRIVETGIEIRYDKRDDIYFPRSGFLFNSFYSYGDKKIFNIGQLQNLGYNDKYSIQRYTGEIKFYFSFTKRQSTQLKGFAGEVRADKLEDSDFFRVGGNNNIRGYREQQYLASRFIYGSLEPRYSISRRSFLLAFADAGYYFKPFDAVNNIAEQSEFLLGYGIGIRLETGIGLIGVSYALGKGDGFLDGKIHFGLINTF
ncbi:MAG: BamA/TamA family outer membrane protein [Ignavibacteriaceae bacterium]|nr:BamA/TamA family outer membrane protein [Ignavibacteriaceae bacterium]